MRKAGSALLALTMTAALLAGCNSNQPSAAGTPGTAGATPDNGKKLTLKVMTISYSGGGWPDDSPIIKKLDEKLNIDLKMQWVPSDSYEEKLNVIAASNEFPDAFMIMPTDFNKWKDKGLFLDVKPELSKYPNLTKYLDVSGLKILNPPGKYLGLPYYSIETRDPIVIRKDWLDRLHLKMPTTTDELLQVAKAFATQDPDGNGKADTVGISFSIGQNGGFTDLNEIMGAFGLPNGWKEVNGQLVPWQTMSKELKDFLTFMQKAYAEGAVDKDFAVNKSRDPWTKLEAGKNGIAWVNPFEVLTQSVPLIKKVDPNAQLVQLPPPKGPTGLQQTKTGATTQKLVINAKIDPEKQQRLLQLFDYMLSDEGFDLIKDGIEGIHFKKNADGTYTKLPAFDTDRPQLLSIWLLRRYDPNIQVHKWDDATYKKQVNDFFTTNAKYAVPNPAAGLDSPTSVKSGAQIDTKLTEAMTQIIIGKNPVDSIDKAIADWKAGGGDAIIKEINAAYAQTK